MHCLLWWLGLSVIILWRGDGVFLGGEVRGVQECWLVFGYIIGVG